LSGVAAAASLYSGNPDAKGRPAQMVDRQMPMVTIERQDDGFQLLRNGEPYFIKGAFAMTHLEMAARCGANSARMWRIEEPLLDEAHRLGLTVLQGLPVGKQRRGFDYGDASQLARQRDEVAALVKRLRGYPAILAWALGNELTVRTTAETRVPLWTEINRLADLVHELDPNRPVITTLGGMYRTVLHEVVEQVPALDAIGLNSYATMLTLPEDISAQGWNDRPYIVTEFGPPGHWQVARTSWGARLEGNSSEKADFCRAAYRHAVEERPRCLGSYILYWGTVMEKTHTWWGTFLEDGSRTETVDVMREIWSGERPETPCPRIGWAGIEVQCESGAASADPRVVRAGSRLRCSVDAYHVLGLPLQMEWDLRPDASKHPGVGGDPEDYVPAIPGCVLETDGTRVLARLPDAPGEYRLYCYVRCEGRGAATANVPLKAI
jgi:hypothetical protein